jgi:hypothetical protein
MPTIKKDSSVQTGPAGVSLVAEAFRQRISERAYELFLKRGQAQGHDLDDWLEAERLVTEEMAAKSPLRSGTLRVESAKPRLDPGRRHSASGQKAHEGRR